MTTIRLVCVLAGLLTCVCVTAAPSICVLPVDDPEASTPWGPGLAAAMTDALSSTTAYCVLPDQQVLDALGGSHGSPPAAAGAAATFGADAVIGGRLSRADGLRLEFETFGDVGAIEPIEAEGCADLVRQAAVVVCAAFGMPEPAAGRFTEDDVAAEAFMAARYYHANGELDSALDAYEDAMVDAGFALAPYQLATLLREAGRWDQARGYYQQVTGLGSPWPRAEMNLGSVYYLLGDAERARQLWEGVVGQQIDPLAVAYATNNLGTALLAAGDTFSARARYNLALSIFPDYAMAIANLGLAARMEKDHETAARLFRSVAEQPGDLTAASFAEKCWADMLRIEGRFEEAIAHYQRALEIRPDYAMSYVNMGVTYKNMGLEDEAEHSYREAIAINTDANASAYAHNNLGNLYMARQMYRVAVGEYQRALEYKPDYQAARENLARAQAMIDQQ